jgi:hypothetical protein
MKDEKVIHEWKGEYGHTYQLKQNEHGVFTHWKKDFTQYPFSPIEKEPHGQMIYIELGRLAEENKKLRAVSKLAKVFLHKWDFLGNERTDLECALAGALEALEE